VKEFLRGDDKKSRLIMAMCDIRVGVIERPQSKSPDFYRALGDIFALKLAPDYRWCGFKALCERWRAHVASSRIRPVLLIDEAQEIAMVQVGMELPVCRVVMVQREMEISVCSVR
jgi:hypothetical protein